MSDIGIGLDPNNYYVLLGSLFGILVLFYVFIAICGKIRKKSHSDMYGNVPFMDISKLQKEGLLTPEETARIRQAQARQIERESKKPHVVGSGDAALLMDPEFRKLEAIAESRPRETNARPKPVRQEPPAPKVTVEEIKPSVYNDVPLPAEVLKMAELGLISPEELENIKKRTRAKLNDLTES